MIAFTGTIKAQAVQGQRFDLFVGVCGYESRASHLARLHADQASHRLVSQFSEQHVLAYSENQRYYGAAGFSFVDSGTEDFLQALGEAVLPMLSGVRRPRVFVDISSQSRNRLADTVSLLVSLGEARPVDVVFGYALAKFQPLPTRPAPNVDIGPVSGAFAGWTDTPGRSLVLVVGLGYEQDRALGAVEFLEPTDRWLLVPTSSIRKYGPAIRVANKTLLESVSPTRIIAYDVEDPNATFAKLASLVLHIGRSGQAVLLPGGPKVLALLSLLLSVASPDVAVWRVTAGGRDEPMERQASGANVFVGASFGSDVSA